MADASFLQTSFLGGRWSPYAQGRADRPDYKEAMNECLNALPIETGAWTRRPGTQRLGFTRDGAFGLLREFHFSENHPYVMEFTDEHLRFWSGAALVTDTEQTVVSISSANPALVNTAQAHGWSTGDQVLFERPTGAAFSGLTVLFNRVLEITVTGSKAFTLADAVTGATIDGSLISLDNTDLVTVARVLDIATPYTLAMLQQTPGIRVVQTDTTAFILNGAVVPQSLVNTSFEGNENSFASFSFGPSVFLDGPYLDPPIDGSTLTPTGTTGTIDLGASAATSINGGQGFLSTDVGRLIRLFSEPAAYIPTHGYTKGDNVKYANTYWTALVNSTNKEPDVSPTQWAINPSGASWTWGAIETVTNNLQITLTLAAADPAQILAGGPLVYDTPIVTWQLGLYSATTGYPTLGTYQEGRLWLGGQTPNRFDACMSNAADGTDGTSGVNFGPTLIDGTVADNCGISGVFNADDVNTMFWMVPDHQGVVCGTQAGEWLITASSLNDPLTPTSIQARRVTKYKCANVEPRHTGLSLVFVQNYQQKLYEYISDVYSGKFSGTNIALASKDLTAPGVAEIAYQYEKFPVIWSRMADGSLAGVTYKRESPFGTQPASFAGWHRHALGHGYSVQALVDGPSADGTTDAVTLITLNPATGLYQVELMTPLFDETATLFDAWFVDNGHPPDAVDFGSTTVTLYGYEYAAGQELDVWAAGLDLGTYTVSTTGTITLTIGTPTAFTEAFLAGIADKNYNNMGVVVRRTTTVTTDLPQTGGILEIMPNSSPISGVSNTVFFPDWDNDLVYIFKSGSSSTSGIRQFRMSDAVEINDVAATALLTSGGASVSSLGCIDNNGNFYFYSSSSNAGQLRKVGSALTLLNTFGTDGSSAFTTDPTHLAFPYAMCPLQVDASHNFVVSLGQYGATQTPGAEVSIINTDTVPMSLLTSNPLGNLVQESGACCQGPQQQTRAYSFGTAYVLGKRGPTASFNDTPMGLYRVSVNHSEGRLTADLTTLGNITPQQVDATWTHWAANSLSNGLVYDGTDGNVICSVHTDTPANYNSGSSYAVHDVVRDANGHDYSSRVNSNVGNDPTTSPVSWTDLGAASYTNTTYLVKLNTKTAAVMWTFAVAGGPDNADLMLQNTRISYGRLAFFTPTEVSGAWPLYWIDTLTGTAVSSQSVFSTQVGGCQAYDDHTNQMVFFLSSYTNTGGGPVNVGSTPSSFSNEYAMFRTDAFTPPPPTVPPTNYFGPFLAGTAFVSRGQILRRLDPQESGARDGPALAKTRRTHMYGMLVANTGVGTGPGTANGGGSLNVGTVFGDLYPAQFRMADDQTLIPVTQMAQGVFTDALQNDYTFDSMLAWEVTRPYPATVLAVTQFLHTQDR